MSAAPTPYSFMTASGRDDVESLAAVMVGFMSIIFLFVHISIGSLPACSWWGSSRHVLDWLSGGFMVGVHGACHGGIHEGGTMLM